MARGFTKEQIQTAKDIDLYRFALEHFPDDFKVEGHEIHLRDHHALTIKEGSSWCHDFSDGRNMDGIRLLTDYLGYEFRDAVLMLLGDRSFDGEHETKRVQSLPKKFSLPPFDPLKQDSVVEFLHDRRKIPLDTVELLLAKNLIYPDICGNMVIVNEQKTMYQIRSTALNPPRKILGSGKLYPNSFWYFMTDADTRDAFVCEGMIDAVSLYELMNRRSGIYCSLSGASNDNVIKKLLQSGNLKVYICTDRDVTGQKCRDKHSDLPSILPRLTDWNEDLCKNVYAGTSAVWGAS